MGVSILLLDSQMVIVRMNEWDDVHLRVGTTPYQGSKSTECLVIPQMGLFLWMEKYKGTGVPLPPWRQKSVSTLLPFVISKDCKTE